MSLQRARPPFETAGVTSSVLSFTVFETRRQQVGTNFWFPAYSRSDETIDVAKSHVPIRVIVRWTDFTPAGAAPPAETPAAAKSPEPK